MTTWPSVPEETGPVCGFGEGVLYTSSSVTVRRKTTIGFSTVEWGNWSSSLENYTEKSKGVKVTPNADKVGITESA